MTRWLRGRLRDRWDLDLGRPIRDRPTRDRPTRDRPTPDGRDEGTVMLLILGFAVVLIGLVVVVVDVSIVLLHQRGVASAADGAALAASQQIDESAFYAQGLRDEVPLSDELVAQAVARYAADVTPATRLSGSVGPGDTVVVVGEREVPLPFGRFLGKGTVTVRSVGRATSPVIG